ncbi:MAG: type VI secretion system accessory protein TagJ [Planctomycetota bacterium]
MTSIDALRSGDVAKALESVKNDVRNEPQEAKHRIFLFQMFTVTGDWDRAMAQLKVAAELDAESKTMADAYQHILQCEALRQEVFEGGRAPLVFGEPEPWIAQMIEALRFTCQQEYAAAAALRDEAFQGAPATPGKLSLRSGEDGQEESFQWLADADSRMGPILEVILQGKLYWVPIHRVAKIEFHDINDLRDCVWIPAQFTWEGGGEMVGMMPVRYPGSQTDTEGAVQLARKTRWDEREAETYLGFGQRMLATDQNEYPLLDIATITFDAA